MSITDPASGASHKAGQQLKTTSTLSGGSGGFSASTLSITATIGNVTLTLRNNGLTLSGQTANATWDLPSNVPSGSQTLTICVNDNDGVQGCGSTAITITK